MTKTKWAIFAAIAVLLLGLAIVISRQQTAHLDGYNEDAIIAASDENGNIADHTRGNTKAKVVIVEYADYQCRACSIVSTTVKQTLDKYSDDVTFIYRNFPLTQIHSNAMAAAAAAEAAGKQDAYWEMHDYLFEHQQEWSAASASERTRLFNEYAQKLNLDINKYTADMSSEEISKKIQFDMSLGKRQGVSSTPSLFINGKAVKQEALQSSENLGNAIEEHIKKVRQ